MEAAKHAAAGRKYAAAIMILLLSAGAVYAKIFDVQPGAGEQLTGGIYARELNKMEMRINGKNVEIKKFKCVKKTRDILDAYYAAAEKNCYKLISNEFLLFSAKMLFGAASCGDNFENFGYIFYVDDGDTGNFIISGSCSGSTELVRAKINNLTSTAAIRGYDDGIRHMDGAERMLSIEFMSGGKTVNYGNFYRMAGISRDELRNYYSDELRKNGCSIIKQQHTKDSDIFFAARNKKDLVLTISGDGPDNTMVFLMG
jgi:hypothetical protein